MNWQEMEYYAFIHLSVNIYTDMSWVLGSEDSKIFNPKDLPNGLIHENDEKAVLKFAKG